MFSSWKALVLVLAISLCVFRVAKPVCLQFTAEADFNRRRIVWCVLTIGCLLSPSFWLYTAIAIPLLMWAAKYDQHPASLFLLLYFVVPPVAVEIPIIGINKLFALSQLRLMSLVILIPILLRGLDSSNQGQRKLSLMDFLVLAYFALDLALFIPYESPTNTLRRALIASLDSVVVYFVFSRLPLNRRSIGDAMASFCLMCALFSPLALYEWAKGWPLYGEVAGRWGVPVELAYLTRGNSLRALVSTGHSLTLGSFMAIGFCFALYLQSKIKSKWPGLAVVGWMCLGLYAALSRAPWITAVLMLFIFLAAGPEGMSKAFKSILVAGVAAGIVMMTPAGDKIIDFLPFVGTVDQDNVTYRQELARLSWVLIQENPFFGDPFFMRNMESLRQGQGIIDLVNAYANVALNDGVVGLALFAGVFVVGLWRAWSAIRQAKLWDLELSKMGASLFAGMLGFLFFIGTAGLSPILYPLVGLLASYANLVAVAKSAALSRGNQPSDRDRRSGMAPGRAHAR